MTIPINVSTNAPINAPTNAANKEFAEFMNASQQEIHFNSVADILAWMREHTVSASHGHSPLQSPPQANLSADSRAIRPGDIFFAFPIPGAGDGRSYVQAAVRNGAIAVVIECEDLQWDDALDVPYLSVKNLRDMAGFIAAEWYAQPDQGMLTVAVTGTNGKTSCSQWLAKTLSLIGDASAVVGTLGVGNYNNGVAQSLIETGFTTPDAIQLQRRLASLKAQGAQALAIEASSIGLDQGRLNGLHIDIAVFTNLTRDHLDYHGDMARYAEAKARLFTWPSLRAAVINLDDAFGHELVQRVRAHSPETTVISYSTEGVQQPDIGNIVASHIRTNYAGTSFHIETPSGSGQIKTQLIGRFNVSNVLAVLGALLAKGVALNKAIQAIEKLTSVPGRMQQLGSQGHVMAVIDYAHTPDALEKTLQALQQVAQERQGQLWCVFGCGGDRDPGKRPQMGKIAQLAQHVVVTSDNPRTENPAAIIEQIVAGMNKDAPAPHVIEDRASAILFAIKNAGEHDVVLLAGKGHESYQDINGKKSPFSDEQHAALALATVATSTMSQHIKRGS